MGVTEALAPATGVFAQGIGGILKYAWVLFPIVIIGALVFIVILIKLFKGKKDQWTHKLKVRRVLKNNLLSDPVFMNMRRFPLIKKAEVFELEKPLLGGYLIPELDQYSGDNEYSIILDKNNRIYTNMGEYFNPDKNSAMVSARHSEIDIQRANLKADFQNINKVNSRIEWATIAKYAFMFMAILCVTIVAIVGISKWGDAQQYKAQEAQSMSAAMDSLSLAMNTVEATVNTQKLEILPMMKEVYKTENIQREINREIIILNNESA